MKKIFFADDDNDILEIVKLILQTAGYIVDTSTNANDIFNYKTDLPNLILLDIWMSGVDGREICYSLKKDYRMKNIPVVFISANASIKEIAEQCEADDFITKPFDMPYLLKKVEALVNP